MTRALVTGATGFVGSHVAEELLGRGFRVRCTVRSSSRLRWLEAKPVEIVTADLLDRMALRRAAEGVDAVFHVAGVLRAASYRGYREGNWRMTANLLEASGRTKFVYVSSLAACGPAPDGTPLTEESPCAPVSLYGRSKREAEQEVWKRRDERPVVVVRPPVVYGPRDEGLLSLYRTLSLGFRPLVRSAKAFSVVHVRDLARGIADAAGDPGTGHVFFLSDPVPYTYEEVTDAILHALGRRAVTVRVPDRVVRWLGAVTEEVTRVLGWGGLFTRDKAKEMTQPFWLCSPEKARRVLGWTARIGLQQGLHETIDWYVREGLVM